MTTSNILLNLNLRRDSLSLSWTELSICLCQSLSVSMSLCLSVSLCRSVCLPLSSQFSVSEFWVSLSLSTEFCICLCQSFCVCLFLCLCLCFVLKGQRTPNILALWKTSCIIPVPKKTTVKVMNDLLRPVALTSAILKVFERDVLAQLQSRPVADFLDPLKVCVQAREVCDRCCKSIMAWRLKLLKSWTNAVIYCYVLARVENVRELLCMLIWWWWWWWW